MAVDYSRLPFWRRTLAGTLDFFTLFFFGGYLIAKMTGSVTADGFRLNGMPALILFALIIAYFIIGNRFFGGTLWKHLLFTKKPL